MGTTMFPYSRVSKITRCGKQYFIDAYIHILQTCNICHRYLSSIEKQMLCFSIRLVANAFARRKLLQMRLLGSQACGLFG